MKISSKAKSKKIILNKAIMKLKVSVNDVKRILKKKQKAEPENDTLQKKGSEFMTIDSDLNGSVLTNLNDIWRRSYLVKTWTSDSLYNS